jgi:4-amino-4-deoxy-L-arabinose transferase-like glycosyltransferase
MVKKIASDNLIIYLGISIVAALLFIPMLGGVHLFDWDEINFAESAREMIQSDDYLTVQINYTPFWEKPPLFIWMQVLSMKVFGINEFAARLPNAVCGIITLLVLFHTGRLMVDTRFGLIWVFLFGGSLLPFVYFKSGIIDPWFNLFIFLGIYFFYRFSGRCEKPRVCLIVSAVFIGLAILTKGPVAMLILILTVAIVWVLKRFRLNIRMKDLLIYLAVVAFVGGFWFILQILHGNFSVLVDFVVYQIRLFRTQDAGHGGFLMYHAVVLLLGVFPASVFALPALLGTRNKAAPGKSFMPWMVVLFWVVLILFTIVKTKIVHYSSLCYFPLTFLAAWSVYSVRIMDKGWKKITDVLLVAIGSAISLLAILLSFIDHYKGWIIEQGWIRDIFAIGCLSADGGWKGYEFAAGLLPALGLVWYFTSRPGNYLAAIYKLGITIVVFLFLSMALIVPRVEAYSQRAAVEFFIAVSKVNAYVDTKGYKSYAHLFYGNVARPDNPKAKDVNWLLTGNIDKPAFFAVKINKKEQFMDTYTDAVWLYEKNGFAFFKRSCTRTP